MPRFFVHVPTCSTTLGIELLNAATMLLSTVAPATAKSYANVKDVLCSVARWPTQVMPPAMVLPGSAGLPSGLPAAGLVPVMLNPVDEYESPLKCR